MNDENPWISVKTQMPPLNEFVEVVYKNKSFINEKLRDFVCRINDGVSEMWTKEGGTEEELGKFDIIYWRRMFPDPWGRKPFIYVTKRGYLKVRVKRGK